MHATAIADLNALIRDGTIFNDSFGR